MSVHGTPTFLTAACVVAAAWIACDISAAGSPQTAPVVSEALLPTGCAIARKPTATAGGASLVTDADSGAAHKRWQPAGGEFQFIIRSASQIPGDASVVACFRWKSPNAAEPIEVRPRQLDLSGDGKTLTVTVVVPDLGKKPANVERALPLVPRAEVRILAIDTQNVVRADVTTQIGITYPVAAFGLAFATVIVACLVLYVASVRRLQHPGILKANWFLRIISTPTGFASLSQLQIMLWTFVVAVSAVYVMSLSGELIDISSGTLVLLGIAGVTGIGAKIHMATQDAAADAAAAQASDARAAADLTAARKATVMAVASSDPVVTARLATEHNIDRIDADAKAALEEIASARADARKNPPPTQVPRWSDLIVNERTLNDGTVSREIDVMRFQMLLFTLITATFVLISVVTSYRIPEISSGFLTLMGISNGVYLGSKVVQS